MEASLFSADFVRLEKAQQVTSIPCPVVLARRLIITVSSQGVIRALELAAETIDELAKGSEADQSTLELKCKSFLEEVQVCTEVFQAPKHDYWPQYSRLLPLQVVQQTLVAIGPSNAVHKPYQSRAYSSQLQTSLLQKQIDIANEQLQAESHNI